MPAPKGHPRWGGRKKGTPNKRSLTAQGIFEKHDFEVIEELIKFFRSTSDELLKLDILKNLLPFRHPKITSQEVHGEIDLNVEGPAKAELKQSFRLMDEQKERYRKDE